MNELLISSCNLLCLIFIILALNAAPDIRKQMNNISSKCDIISYNITKIDKCKVCNIIYDIELELYMKKYDKQVYFQENVSYINLDKYKDSCYYIKGELLSFNRYIKYPDSVIIFYVYWATITLVIMILLICNEYKIESYILIYFSSFLFYSFEYMIDIYHGNNGIFIILNLLAVVLLSSLKIHNLFS